MIKALKILTLSVLIPATTIAQNNAADSLASNVIASNPALQTARQRVNAQIISEKDDNTPAPTEIGFSHQWGMNGIGNKWSAEINQSFDWPGLYKARSKAISARAAAAEAELDAAYTAARAEALDLVDNLIYCNKRKAVIVTMRNQMAEMTSHVHKAYEMGELTILDVKKTEFELFSLDNKVADIEVERLSALTALEEFSGTQIKNTENIYTYPSLTLQPADTYLANANNNPRSRVASLNAQASRMEAKAAKLSSLPGFSVGYGYEYEMGEKFNGINLGISLPFFSGKNKRKADELLAQSFEYEAKTAANSYINEILRLHTQANTLAARLTSSKQLFSTSNDYLSLLYEAYKGGELDIIHYLDEVNYYLDASIEYLDTEYRYQSILNTLSNRNFR